MMSDTSTQTDTQDAKSLIDTDIWEVVGLNITPEEQQEYNEQFNKEAWLTLLDEKLPKILQEGEYKSFKTRVAELNMTPEQFVEKIKDIYSTLECDLEKDFDSCMEEVMRVFVEDQINYIERRLKSLKDQTEREVKLSLIKTLRDLFSQNQWDQMGVIFRKIDGYQLPEGLVLHL